MNHRDKTGWCVCRDCGQTGWKERAENQVNTIKFVYRDDRGRRWNKRQCPECVTKWHVARRSPRHLLTDSKNKKGYDAEVAAADYFRSFGFEVEQARCHGPDLIISYRGVTRTCEVRNAVRNGHCYWVPAVYPNRRGDDFIAIVLPDGSIHTELMVSHLSKCSPKGGRAITSLVRPLKRQDNSPQVTIGPKEEPQTS